MNLAKSLLPLCLLTVLVPFPALAAGEVTVEDGDGNVQTYTDVEIISTPDVVYFRSSEGGTTLQIVKNNCDREGQLLVCNKAQAGVNTDGVVEQLDVNQIVLFINPTTAQQPISGSKVVMGPNTVLLEMTTAKGTYISGLGKIDGSSLPVGAAK